MHRLCRIPRGKFSFTPYDHFKGRDRKGGATWAKWDVDLIMVANPEGMEKYYQHDALAAAIRDAVGDRELVVNIPGAAQ